MTGKNSVRSKRILAGAFALAAMQMPLAAFGMDSSPRLDRVGNMLPLPPIPYLDSMRWMNWKPAPLFKVDTLLLPDSTRLPADYRRDMPRVG